MADYDRREVRSRGREPPAYDGSAPFDQWKISFFSYVALENIRYIELTNAYPTDCDRHNNGAIMDNDELERRYDVDGMDEKDKVKKLNTRLYFYLCSFTDGAARLISDRGERLSRLGSLSTVVCDDTTRRSRTRPYRP